MFLHLYLASLESLNPKKKQVNKVMQNQTTLSVPRNIKEFSFFKPIEYLLKLFQFKTH